MKKHFFNSSPFKLIGFLLGSLGLGLFLLAIFWKPPLNPRNNFSAKIQQIFKATKTVVQISTQKNTVTKPFLSTPTQNIPEAAIHTPTPVWMIYDGIDFRDKEIDIIFTMQCNQETIHFKPFQVVSYSPEVVASSEFLENYDLSMAWEHRGFYGLLIHSGLAYGIGELPAYPLQIYFEKDARGFFHSPNVVNQHLQDCVINAEMQLLQEDTVSVNKVVAAVRVPPSEVDEVSQHAMDLVPYLAETYPDSGFDQMYPPGLLIYFCGQLLTGEMANPNFYSWTQARFIIGLMPLTAD